MSFFAKPRAAAIDLAMCAALNAVQMRHRLHASSRDELERYIIDCETLSLAQFYQAPHINVQLNTSTCSWPSPVTTGFPENDHNHVDLFLCERGASAPTIFLLHALMSCSDTGYREWARKFNARGWNACFVHLPFHYSRTPRGFFNGELAISADLVRTAQGLRQAVIELRQLMQIFRERGCREFALWASSYGGWIGALLSFVERDFRFVALMEPIVNIEHAIWECAAAVRLRSQLRQNGITHALVERHFHLTSPMHNKPLCENERVIFAAGDYDQIARGSDIASLHEKWRGSELLRVPQGHFGYLMMPAMFARLIERELL